MRSILIAGAFLLCQKLYGQNTGNKAASFPSHGFAIGYHYDPIEKSVVSLGYHFVHNIGNGDERFIHRYSADYLLNSRIWGATVDLTLTIWTIYKIGLQGGLRNGNLSKDEHLRDYYFSPQFGLDFFVGDFSFGPVFHSAVNYDRQTSFKLSAHFNYPIWGGGNKKFIDKARVF